MPFSPVTFKSEGVDGIDTMTRGDAYDGTVSR